MNTEIIQSMQTKELRKYVEFLLWHYRVVDAFWFIYVAEQFGQAVAERINEKVWSRVSGMAAKDLLSRFNIGDKGLEGFVNTIRLFPWCIITAYEIEESEDKLIITVPSCATQKARINRGLDEFNCKDMHKGSFISFAKEIDDRIRVECIFAPPDAHPEDISCKWCIYLENDRWES